MSEENMTYRQAARRAAMATIFTFITANPGCVAYEISKATNISHSEISRYIRWKRMEWRTLADLMDMRERNRPLYNRLLHDAAFDVRDGVDGMMINTSKREMFDRYCLNHGHHLTVDRTGHCFLYDFSFGSYATGSQKKLVLRMFDLSTIDQKKTFEGRACQEKLL